MNGTSAIPNAGHGIYIQDSPNNVIGLAEAGRGNLISGNEGDGVRITGTFSTGNEVHNTAIGTDLTDVTAIPNSGWG